MGGRIHVAAVGIQPAFITGGGRVTIGTGPEISQSQQGILRVWKNDVVTLRASGCIHDGGEYPARFLDRYGLVLNLRGKRILAGGERGRYVTRDQPRGGKRQTRGKLRVSHQLPRERALASRG